MTTKNSYNKTLSIFFACAMASVAVMTISPGQSEACGSYGEFVSEEERIEDLVKLQISRLGFEDLKDNLINANADAMTQRINGFEIDKVRRRGRSARVKLRRLSDGRIQNFLLRYDKGNWAIVNMRTERKRSRRAIRA